MRFVASKDFLSGAMFALFGAIGLYIGTEYRMGTASRMGPGYMPNLLCWSLVALGALIMLQGLLKHEAIDRGRWRPLVFILLAVLGFGLLIDRMGLLVSGLVLLLVGSFAGPEFKAKEAAILTVLLLAMCSGIFIWGLGLPITLLPR
jgi:hypothetical protein